VSDTRALLPEYLGLRRSLGYKLVRAEALLDDFASYLEGSGTPYITVEAALSWAVLPPNALSNWRAQRLGVVRCFARYCNAVDPSHQVPPMGLVPTGQGRPAPFIYSAKHVKALMRAARQLRRPLRAATLETVIGLLAVTGLRVAEVVRLVDADVDHAEGALTVRASKAGKSRLLPLHPSTVEALRAYMRARDLWRPRPKTTRLFVSSTGTPWATNNLGAAFVEALSGSGLSYSGRRPRLGDFRHSFAVNTLVRRHRAGEDVNAKLPLLSAYLGHVSPASTYWYLSASPQLLAAAVSRLEPGDEGS
jgi:integrase/recombinase XerD